MGNEIVEKYCRATGKGVTDVINGKKDKTSVFVRNALMYLTWKQREHTICREFKKKQLLTQIGKEFGIGRVNCYEQLDRFAANLEVYQDWQQKFEEIRSLV